MARFWKNGLRYSRSALSVWLSVVLLGTGTMTTSEGAQQAPRSISTVADPETTVQIHAAVWTGDGESRAMPTPGERRIAASVSATNAWAWGNNSWGQLGGTTAETCSGGYPCSTTPIQVSNLVDAVSVAADSYGSHSLALKADGTVWAWGGERQWPARER